MTTMNWQVFAKDPRSSTIPNDGVTEVGLPTTDKEWSVLRYELSTFVCEGQYRDGLERILGTYLSNLDRDVQPAVWVSGFYGSGKSHLVRVLEYLWRDVTFPDGATARSLVNLHPDIHAHLRHLNTVGAQTGGLWAAAGTLGAGAGDSVRLAILGIVFRAAGLPENYAQARFVLWLRQQGLLDTVKANVEQAGDSFESELNNLYVSPSLAEAVLKALPDFAETNSQARLLFKAQFQNVSDIENEEMLEVMTSVLELQSGERGRLPCTLLVLDELQQYVGDDSDRTLRVQVAVQAITRRFGSQLLVVATGQSALQAHPQLQKLRDRFTVQIQLTDTDVERVLRQVVLRKAPAREPDVQDVLTATSGEIDRHLQGTKIEPRPSDRDVLVADYPLLPSRRRFWERVLRAIDRAGSAGQLRTQLRTVHESTKQVADEPLGTVVPADTIYSQQLQSMLQSGVLLREVFETIQSLNEGTPEGALRSRLCSLVFLIGQLPTDGGAETGIHPTADNLTDLLVRDLKTDGVALRRSVPAQLAYLVERGVLQTYGGPVGDEFRLQTRESSEWEGAYRTALTRAEADAGRIGSERNRELRETITDHLRNLPLTQGTSKTPRKVEAAFTSERPQSDTAIPVWIRDEWTVRPSTVIEDAQAAGANDATVYVLLPKRSPDQLKSAIAGYLAATEVLHTRGAQQLATAEALEARRSMETRRDRHRNEVDAILNEVTANARVFQGGGNEVIESTLRAAIQKAAERAVVRRFNDFEIADNPNWKRVVDRAREGSNDPLSVIGHTSEPKDHPACAKVLAFVGAGGKRGNDVRRAFEAPPYGWPREAIDGALLSLMNADLISATLNGSPALARALDGTKIGQATFKSQSVVLTVPQRLRIRSVMTEADVTAKSNEEGQAVPAFLNNLRRLAEDAGGQAPAPAAPNTHHLDEIRDRSGNEQLLEIFNQQERLSADIRDWKAARHAIEARLPRWRTAERLLKHANGLAIAEEVKPQLDAIRDQRALLKDPDPVPPLIGQLVSSLREELASRYKHLITTYGLQTRHLQESETWDKLPDEIARDIMLRNNLTEPRQPALGTEDEILTALDRASLTDLDNQADAIEGRVRKALHDAAIHLEPTSVQLQLPKTTLKTPEQAKAYIEQLEKTILDHIGDGHPVVI